ncbi:hypothetical protein SAMN06265349_101745 [Flavobacterium resistens]|uniref:Uncharacterized protein n=1 Tax=Flavobacterium resistens TaxID=443612 RepID=A0A521B6V5_9FLAO|nr:hypothetical protein [Flavobacterium resistens]MRX70253.1 hypothetical protein [Flavobacterium resistens]SMO42837.1 hypothetical protein SAMN06265349_101745 [Flavobacterium resistens]
MKITLHLTIEVENASHATRDQIQNNLRLYRINDPVNNRDLINEFGLDEKPLMIDHIEQITAGLEEHYTIKIRG